MELARRHFHHIGKSASIFFLSPFSFGSCIMNTDKRGLLLLEWSFRGQHIKDRRGCQEKPRGHSTLTSTTRLTIHLLTFWPLVSTTNQCNVAFKTPVFKVSLVSLLLVRLLALILSMIHYAMRHSQQHMCSSVLKSSSYPCFASINQTLLSSFSEGLFVRRRRTFYIGKTWATKSLCQAAVPEE